MLLPTENSQIWLHA